MVQELGGPEPALDAVRSALLGSGTLGLMKADAALSKKKQRTPKARKASSPPALPKPKAAAPPPLPSVPSPSPKPMSTQIAPVGSSKRKKRNGLHRKAYRFAKESLFSVVGKPLRRREAQ